LLTSGNIEGLLEAGFRLRVAPPSRILQGEADTDLAFHKGDDLFEDVVEGHVSPSVDVSKATGFRDTLYA
jgi:hypothetical protein